MRGDIIVKGVFKSKQIYIFHSKKGNRKINKALESKCKKIWSEIKKESYKSGKEVWDSIVYRLNNIEVRNDAIRLHLGTIPFSTRLALNQCTNDLITLGEGYHPMALYTSVFVKTKDNYYVFIEKSDKLHSNRRTSFVGGILSKSEKIVNNGQDLFESVRNELVEELGLDIDKLRRFRMLGGFINRTLNVCLLFKCNLSLGMKDVEKAFCVNHEQEVDKLIFMKDIKKKHFFLDNFDQAEYIEFLN